MQPPSRICEKWVSGQPTRLAERSAHLRMCRPGVHAGERYFFCSSRIGSSGTPKIGISIYHPFALYFELE